MKSEAKLVAKLRSEAETQEQELAEALGEQFLGEEKRLVKGVSQGIAEQLEALAGEAEVLVT
jgi:hypothetical protein